MVGIAARLSEGEIKDDKSVSASYDDLLNNKKFQTVTINTARTTDKHEVNTRLDLAIEAFKDIK